MMKEVKIEGGEDLVRAVKRYGQNCIEEVKAITDIVQKRIVNDARSNHPYTDRTTNLTQSIQQGPVEVSDKKISGVVEARMEYASFVEFGTSRSKPYPFMLPALLQNLPTFRASIQAAIKRARAK